MIGDKGEERQGMFRVLRRCPNCGRDYDPELVRKDDRPIQEQYPNEPAWKREQLISGLCSDKCWKEYLGVEE